MSRIRSKNTKIEVVMRELLTKNKIKFEMHPKIVGSPDFLVGKRTLIFCDGDFWHGYHYKKGRIPQQRFWREKIERNMKRDKKLGRKLRREGWSVIRLWEHDIMTKSDYCLKKILRLVK